ncbi:abc transporter sub-family a-like protein 16 [Dermatophagoides farinae]|nr:abc transporter sub-family a-like protein 16 [Dermatophagoides farinae]
MINANQPNLLPMAPEPGPPCIETRNLSFHYKASNPVLKNITINVPQGRIYALLGSSGCGKTTLLRMILGMLKPKTGTIRVFGMQPGTAEVKIPGPGVGYMPQDLALFRLFNIEETFEYYGRLYGIPIETIKERIKYYIEFLNLPVKTRLITQLSGGQQRRVSLAVTLMHQPPLLILDEPTVGVDSVLRLKIWNYLEELCTKLGTTVIITTHYTEEARNSYRVGFVDSGIILAEDNPQRLLFKYNCRSLEDVFLELCLERARQPEISNENKPQISQHCSIPEVTVQIIVEESNDNHHESSENSSDGSIEQIEMSQIPRDMNNNNNNSQTSQEFKATDDTLISPILPTPPIHPNAPQANMDGATNTKLPWLDYSRLHALLAKNYLLYRRNPVSIILMNIIPLVQVTLFCVTFARNPENIPVAVVNHENRTQSLSNLFIDQLDQQSLSLHYFDNLDDAIKSVHDLQTRNVITFPSNFSRFFRKRFLKPEQITDEIIEQSRISLYPDTTHAVFYLYTYQKVLEGFEKFLTTVGKSMGFNPNFFGSPVVLTETMYGQNSLQYLEFVTPGMIIAVVHGLSMLIGSFTIIRERFDGHLERGFVAGIRTTEILLSHIIFYLVPLFTQVVLVLFLTFYIFDSQSLGSLWEVFLMTFVMASQGLIFGITMSITCQSQVASLLMVFIMEMPMIFTSGVLWPLESVPPLVKTLAMFNPLTLPIRSLHYIMLRGWTLMRPDVAVGLISAVSYLFVSLISGFVWFELFK